jgi:hypothetical protein
MNSELGFYYVRLHGGHVALTVPWLWIFRRRGSYGFYTTRYVRAANRASAEAQAIALVRAELEEKELKPSNDRQVAIAVEEVSELDGFGDAVVPGAGFTFYPEGS